MKILITGSAGFIGSNLVLRLLNTESPIDIVGLDSINDYYDVSLKEWRLRQIDACVNQHPESHYTFIKGNLADKPLIDRLFAEEHFDVVVNLAAQAGVRYSIDNPDAYIESNIVGFYNILEACRHSYDASAHEPNSFNSCNSCSEKNASAHEPNPSNPSNPCSKKNSECNEPNSFNSCNSCSEKKYEGVKHLVYASSSSVYGGNTKVPFAETDQVDNPVSLYAATKKSNELLAHAYSRLYNIPTTGLRFFTVYGPAGRPDMAYFGFTNKLIKGETIRIFNYGNCQRDFTYIDDIVEGIQRVIHRPQPYAIYNIGGSHPENLLDFVQILQEELIKAKVLPADFDFEAHKQLVPMQPGDVPITYADTSALERDFSFKPHTSLQEGLRRFAEWYKDFYAS